ncbi:hypothetical protein [Tepidibacter sp. Z1-5]|uniref:hypothetical protein n=1 Tax=Tepidibacter sp. Z1-5 TaxID=3134138 RepID=UPI0030BAF411
MKRHNKISSILLCFLLMLLFTACGSTEANSSTNEFEKAKTEIQQAESSSNENESTVAFAETTSNNQTTIIPYNNKICHIRYPNHGRF